MSRDSSRGGLWPDDDREINSLTHNIGLWPQGGDDVPDETSLQTRCTILREGCWCPTMPDGDEYVFFDSRWLVHR